MWVAVHDPDPDPDEEKKEQIQSSSHACKSQSYKTNAKTMLTFGNPALMLNCKCDHVLCGADGIFKYSQDAR